MARFSLLSVIFCVLLAFAVSAGPGDADGDGKVGLGDLILVGANWDMTIFDPRADLNGDGSVGLGDLILVGANFGTTYEEEEPPVASDVVVFVHDFDSNTLGPYSENDMDDDWDPTWNRGFPDRATIVSGADAFRVNSMQVRYPSSTYSSGTQFYMVLDESYDELYVSFWIMFADDFDFVKGGKIPGLGGGEANTGGDSPNGRDGWSARIMWQSDGGMNQYVYHPDQPGTYGEHFHWDLDGERIFNRGQWHHVETRVVINTPGQHDGIIQSWFDGELALDERSLRFRDVDSFSIDTLLFETFFGGGDSSYAPPKDEFAYYDELYISTERIGFCGDGWCSALETASSCASDC